MGEWDVRYLGSRARAADVRTFTFERPEALTYKPGQFFFVLLGSKNGPESPPIEHHFSFSSSPTEANVEFTTKMTGSEFKNRLADLAPGDTVHIAGPDGAFVLASGMRAVAFICAGIGITPARSVVRWALDTGTDVDVVVLYANRDVESVAFREEFDAVTAPTVRIVNVLSSTDSAWQGRRGRIDADVIRAELPDWDQRHFFVSGPAVMVDDIVKLLLEQVGVQRDRVMSEHFPGYAALVI